MTHQFSICEPDRWGKSKMIDYKHVVQSHNQIVHRLSEYSGLPTSLVNNIVLFTKCLVKRKNHHVDDQIFTAVFGRFFKLTDSALSNMIYIKLCKTNTAGEVTVEGFARIVCMFLSDNLDIKIDYVFVIYDHNGDGLIDTSDINFFVKACKCVTDVDDSEREDTFVDLCPMASESLGVTHDEPIGLEAFRARVKANPLNLHILAQCFPPRGAIESFKASMTDKTFQEIKTTYGSIRLELLYELTYSRADFYHPVILHLP